MRWVLQNTGWVAVIVLMGSRPALSQSPVDVDYPIDGTVTGVAFLGTALLSLVPVDEERLWDSELIGFDEGVRGRLSASSAALSDSLVLVTVVTPLVAQLGRGTDRRLGDATLLYGETLGLNLLLNSGAKALVQRPRPYTYSRDPRVAAFAREEGGDSRRSFYSGHASTAFAAAVAGSMLFAYTTEDAAARATMWGVELALAAATANLRVRAGKHFYTDVIVGAVVGSAIGFAVPHLHRGDSRYKPEAYEWAAMAGGVVAGALISQLLPLESDVPVSLGAARMRLVPLALESGSGLALAGAF